jgi:hypothetical protein
MIVLLAWGSKPLLLRHIPVGAGVPMRPMAGVPIGAEWPANQTQSMSQNASSLVMLRTCTAAGPVGVGFLRPSVTASFSVTLTTISEAWYAPSGTTVKEIDAKAAAAGLSVPDEFFDVPPAACEMIYGLDRSEQPAVGTYHHTVPAAVAYNVVQTLVVVGVPLLLFGLVRLVFTTRAERSRLRASAGLCRRCRYQLGGLPVDAPCPECGAIRGV